MGFFKKDVGQKIEIRVEGMVCGHCELHVQEALNKVEGVKKSKASKSKKNVIITLKEEASVDVDTLIDVVNATGYHASK